MRKGQNGVVAVVAVHRRRDDIRRRQRALAAVAMNPHDAVVRLLLSPARRTAPERRDGAAEARGAARERHAGLLGARSCPEALKERLGLGWCGKRERPEEESVKRMRGGEVYEE